MKPFYEANLSWQARAAEEEKQLQDLLKVLRRELSHAPKGSLTIAQEGGRTWYRQRIAGDDPKSIYLNRKNEDLIYKLAQKRYDIQLLRAVEQELAQLEKGKKLSFTDLGAIYSSFPDAWKPFIEPHVLPDELFIEQWLKEHRATASGDPFKSKAEQLHDRIFTGLKAPNVYEPELFLEGYGIVHPDFVVLCVRTRQTFYHEHFGMMSDPDYCAKALAKLRDYHRNGFYEGKNLLVTMECDRFPMSARDAELYFREYLL